MATLAPERRPRSRSAAAPSWSIDQASTIESALAPVYAATAFSVAEAGQTVEQGFRPAVGAYDALWTRDHAYVLWHNTAAAPAAARRQFVSHRIAASRGGWVPDRIDAAGTPVYRNPGAGLLPFMDGIAFVVLALWADWKATGDTSTFIAERASIDTCLAAVPRSKNGCVWSDPQAPSVDYGFTDTVLKTGDVAYGTALQAWSYKMLAEMAGDRDGPYSARRADAEAGLATLRRRSGFYAASSLNNAASDDVWATALVAAEGLAPLADLSESARALASAYRAGTVTQRGWVRHLPAGQAWAGTRTTLGSYQNGGYWLTPVWDCVRAVERVDPVLARIWAAEALDEVGRQVDAQVSVGRLTAPYEWFNGDLISEPKGYIASAAVVHRFL